MINPEIFPGKSFQELLKDINDNVVTKRGQLETLSTALSNLITNANSAALITPLVKDLLDVSIKNDEHLVKMATIIQRVIASEQQLQKVSQSNSLLLSEEEKAYLLENAKEESVKELEKITEETEDVVKLAGKAKEAVKSLMAGEQNATENEV